MNTELLEALNVLEKEKSISKDTLLEAIEQSLIQACKNHFGKADNIKVNGIQETNLNKKVDGQESLGKRLDLEGYDKLYVIAGNISES